MNKEDIKVIEVDDNENIDVIEVDDNESINNIALNNLLKGEPGKDGEPGTTNYNEQENKPKINGVELVSNKTSEELGINIPTKLSQLTNDKDFIDKTYHDSTKVDKEEGKGLSSNDFTNDDKEKLSSLENYDDTQVKQDINTIKEKIPTQATNNNKLADKDFVNSSLNSITAFYITKNADGDQFNNKSELDSATEFYSGGELRVPTRNDYCIVLEDETKDNSTTRYIYQNNQWEFQYVVNETPLTSEQVKAINSGITPELVAKLQGIDLTNVVRDADYVHTDNNYTKEDKDKLSSLSNDYNEIENKPRKLYKPPSRRVNIADIEDGAYDIASEFILRLSSSVTVSAGSILIKDSESCSIQTLYGGYSFYYDEDANKWYGGYYANSDDVESLILSGTTMSKLSFNSITDLSKVSYGIYINSSNDSSININVLGEERIITGFYINSILIVDFQHNVFALGTKNLIFKYDSTNNYYNEPIDLDELNNRLTNIEDRLTAGGL